MHCIILPVSCNKVAAVRLLLHYFSSHTFTGALHNQCPAVLLQALCPGVRRCFRLDMLPGGRRDGRLVRAEPAVECSDNESMVFMSRHPRFHPAP